VLTDDGLYRQPWFLESFLELGPDLEEATAKAKRFAILWELKGCPSCKQMHLVNFARPEISGFIRERFEICSSTLSARERSPISTERSCRRSALPRNMACASRQRSSSSRRRVAGLASRKPRDREATRAQGYLVPKDFQALFAYVSEKAYERGSLTDYLKSQS
jgi:thioredoxin-related protein